MFENLKQILAGIGPAGRIGLIAGVIVILALSGALAYWSFNTSYKALFTDLQMRDSAAIVAELERLKIPYKLADGGRRIMVPEADVYTTRLKLMGKGVPLSGGVGFEIFDKNDFGMTEFAQRINYQRALQGELARTIMSIQGVKYARVGLVLPETSLFKENKSKPKASVGLIVSDGTTLEAEQISGIQRLVAATVPGLKADRVTIVDQHGVTLSRNEGVTDGDISASGKFDIKKQIENYLESKITAVLNHAFGKGKAIVSVDVSLDMDKIKTTQESMVPLSRMKNGEAVGGVVRRRTTINRTPNYGVVNGNGKNHASHSGERAQNSTSEIEYKFGRKVEEVVSSPGSVRHLSVGVLVPYHMDSERLAEIRRLVAVTVGINKARGDDIAVYPIDRYVASQAKNDMAAAAILEKEKTAIPSVQDKKETILNKKIDTNASGDVLDASTWERRLRSAWHVLGKPYGYVFIGGLSLVLLVIGALLTSLVIKRRKDSVTSQIPELSQDEREQLLHQLMEWIEAENSEARQGAMP